MIHFRVTLFALTFCIIYWKSFVFDDSPNDCSNVNYMSFCFSKKTLLRNYSTGLSLFTSSLSASLKKNNFRYLSPVNRQTALYLCSLLLLLSYAPEPNPGPSHVSQPQADNESHFPCGTCDVTVSWSERGVACDTCGIWYHTRCQSIPTQSYERLQEDISWHCAICGGINGVTTFDLYGVDWSDTSTSFLGDSSCTTPTETTFKPGHSSTPSRASQQNKSRNRPLRILDINFQSAQGKKAETSYLIDSMKPDIIFRCETWLDNSISNNEIPTQSTAKIGTVMVAVS